MLSRDPSAISRASIVRKISDQYQSNGLTENEREIAAEIFSLVLKDKDSGVRKAMSEGLSSCATAPLTVIQALAKDANDEVAIPVLRESIVLTEEQLLEIIRSTNVTVRLVAVASRDFVESPVSDALVGKRITDVVLTLVGNNGAQIAEESFDKIADSYFGNDQLLNMLMQRKPVPTRAIKRCVHNAMDSARHSMQERQLDTIKKVHIEERFEADLLRDMQAIQTLGVNPSPYACEKLAMDLMARGRISANLLLLALSLGHVKFFAVVLAKRGHTPMTKAMTICAKPKNKVFSALYERAELPIAYLPFYMWMIEKAEWFKAENLEQNATATAVTVARDLQTAISVKTLPEHEVVSQISSYLAQLED